MIFYRSSFMYLPDGSKTGIGTWDRARPKVQEMANMSLLSLGASLRN